MPYEKSILQKSLEETFDQELATYIKTKKVGKALKELARGRHRQLIVKIERSSNDSSNRPNRSATVLTTMPENFITVLLMVFSEPHSKRLRNTLYNFLSIYFFN